jgi:hypothetical protein
MYECNTATRNDFIYDLGAEWHGKVYISIVIRCFICCEASRRLNELFNITIANGGKYQLYRRVVLGELRIDAQ